ncbi:MAG: efflux RND transporter periplasmic adaptor subunit [Acidobacteria bacterium]|nr:efflux RND transporter periplasmic adaptor subunit [Acidobacteriota bacterium]
MRKSLGLLTVWAMLVGCNRQAPVVQISRDMETISITHWTERTELFLEYPPLVTEEKGRFAVHLTDLRTFRPLTEGRVTVELRQDTQPAQIFATEGPSSPGIFGVDVQPQVAGSYSLAVSLHSANLEDRHELGKVTIYAKRDEVPAATDSAGEEAIPFLKEQQWTLDFATEPATEREIRESLRVSAEVRPRSGGEVEVTASILGRLATAPPLPVIGASVSQGQPLASLIPPTPAPADLPSLELTLAEATTEFELARTDRERADRLLEVGAVPARRLQQAQAAEAQAAARVKAAQDRLGQYQSTREADSPSGSESAFLLRAPIAGVVTDVKGTPGANVIQGQTLFSIVAVDRVYVVGSVPETDAHRLSQLTGAEIELPGVERALPASRLVSVSRWIDPSSRTLGVIYEVANPERQFAIGQSLFLRLFLSPKTKAVAVPGAAVVDDGGRPVVFVQVEGESFVRRPVRLGARESNSVQILEGVRPGERIVSRGAYLIRLAALSPQIPAHGHVH